MCRRRALRRGGCCSSISYRRYKTALFSFRQFVSRVLTLWLLAFDLLHPEYPHPLQSHEEGGVKGVCVASHVYQTLACFALPQRDVDFVSGHVLLA